MPRIFRNHLISVACIFFSTSATRVHDSRAYKYKEMTVERISRYLELSVMLSFQTDFSRFSAAVVRAVLQGIWILEASPDTTAPRHLKLLSVSSFFRMILISILVDAVGHQFGLHTKRCWCLVEAYHQVGELFFISSHSIDVVGKT